MTHVEAALVHFLVHEGLVERGRAVEVHHHRGVEGGAQQQHYQRERHALRPESAAPTWRSTLRLPSAWARSVGSCSAGDARIAWVPAAGAVVVWVVVAALGRRVVACRVVVAQLVLLVAVVVAPRRYVSRASPRLLPRRPGGVYVVAALIVLVLQPVVVARHAVVPARRHRVSTRTACLRHSWLRGLARAVAPQEHAGVGSG
mmetsp:Transcript_4342/g.15587  ORF Transcript_4342/g.15587 Transcript_4342/m.15587 type:complete len:202 (+) Transcript_4342:785-1390(+)